MTRNRAKGIEPKEELLEGARRALASDDERALRERLRMSSHTIARSGGGMRLNHARVELARLRLGIEGDRG